MGLTTEPPHAEVYCTECLTGLSAVEVSPQQSIEPSTNKISALISYYLNESFFAINLQLLSARSRGSVALTNANPISAPLIDHAYLSDPLDMLVFAEAVKLDKKTLDIARACNNTKSFLHG